MWLSMTKIIWHIPHDHYINILRKIFIDYTFINEPNTYPDLEVSDELERGDLMAQEGLSLQEHLQHHLFQEDQGDLI